MIVIDLLGVLKDLCSTTMSADCSVACFHLQSSSIFVARLPMKSTPKLMRKDMLPE